MSRTFAGPYPIMQPSGDRYTLFLNSMRNVAVTGASLAFPPGTPIAICGDDSIVQGAHSPERDFRPGQWSIRPKRHVSLTGVFCGWRFGGPRLVTDLEALTYRARIAVQRGESSPDYWRSLIEQLAYTEGDSWDYSAVSALIRFAIKTYHLPLRDPFPVA